MSACCINRNIVECKVLLISFLYLLAFVLIETLWNVKCEMFSVVDFTNIVLIETLWNVKVLDPQETARTSSY